MANRPVRDEWLLPTLEGLIARDAFEALKQQEPESYWDAAVRGGSSRMGVCPSPGSISTCAPGTAR